MGKITLLLVDKRELFREGLVKLLHGKSNIEVVGTCSDGLQAIEKAGKSRPNVVLMDTELPQGKCAETTQRICELLPEAKVVILTHSTESADLLAAIKAGALGYVTKDITLEDLIKAISLVIDGEVIIGAPIARALFEEFTSLEAKPLQKEKRIKILSEREREVLSLVAKGASNSEIAATLFISEHTVKVHLHNIMQKLHVRSRQQAAVLVVEEELRRRIVKEREQ